MKPFLVAVLLSLFIADMAVGATLIFHPEHPISLYIERLTQHIGEKS